MNLLEALWIAIVQGATELFPVSSLGHAVVLPALLRSGIDQAAPAFLPFIVLLHAGTAVALLAYFWRDWFALARGVLGADDPHRVQQARHVLLLLIVATIPAGLLGFLLEHYVRGLFASPLVAALFLAINGCLLLFGQVLRDRRSQDTEHRAIATLTVVDALIIGCWQCLALIPGISRSGATIIGGLTRGINYAGSAHFSFLIALPIIAGATLHQVPKLLHADIPAGVFQMAFIAAVVSGIVAWLSTWFLMRYFRNHDSWAMNPFGIYCLVFGLGSLAVLVLR